MYIVQDTIALTQQWITFNTLYLPALPVGANDLTQNSRMHAEYIYLK